MPYIRPEQRPSLDEALNDVRPRDEGELNYCITRLCHRYLQSRPGGVRYAHLNAVVGALECSKLELYRRVVGPYEDQKIAENGDVRL